MKLYRNHYRADDFTSTGYEFFTSREAAVRAWNGADQDNVPGHTRNDMAEPIEFDLTKAGVVSLLQRCASHPDNG